MEVCGQVDGPAIFGPREIVSRFVTHFIRGVKELSVVLKNYNNGHFENRTTSKGHRPYFEYGIFSSLKEYVKY